MRGEGVRLQDREGHWYLDGLSGVFVTGLGYGNERIIQAATDQIHDLHFAPPCTAPLLRPSSWRTRLREIAPAGLRGEHGVAVKLLSGGSEANRDGAEAGPPVPQAVGASPQVQAHRAVRRLSRGHDGGARGERWLGAAQRLRAARRRRAAYPSARLPPLPLRQDLRPRRRGITCARLVERTIEAEDPETVAAVIMEPMSPLGRFRGAATEYFAILRAACDKHNVLLIFDEIITGVRPAGPRGLAPTTTAWRPTCWPAARG